MGGNRRVLVVGGGFSGVVVAKDLKWSFDVTIVDAKEFFEYTPGILRAFVKPSHFDTLSFCLADVVKKMGVKFIWGEVKSIDADGSTALIKPRWKEEAEVLAFDYCRRQSSNGRRRRKCWSLTTVGGLTYSRIGVLGGFLIRVP